MKKNGQFQARLPARAPQPSLKTVDVEDGHMLTHTLGKGPQDKNQPQTSAQAQCPEFAARFIPQRIPTWKCHWSAEAGAWDLRWH